MTVTRSRSPSLSELPGRFPTEPEFKIARKPVGSGGSTPAPKPVSAEDMQRQRLNADQQMRKQVLQPMGISRGNRPADKNGGPPPSTAHLPQTAPGNPGNCRPVKKKPLDEFIPQDKWALEPKQYEALQKNPNDPQALFHIAFYGPGPQALPPASVPQDHHVLTRELSGLSAKTYPPRTAPAQPFLPNNGYPVLRNARSWQAPQQAMPYAQPGGRPDQPPPLPPKGEPLKKKPPPLPPRNPPLRPLKEPIK